MPKLVPYRMVKPEAWPMPFQRFIAARAAADDPLLRSKATTWRPASYRHYVIGLGYFLGWLTWSGRYQDSLELAAYVTRDVVKAYAADMERFGLAPPTIASRLDALHAALIALAPKLDRGWLMKGINRLRAIPSDRRRTRQRTVHTADVVEAGMKLMRATERMDGQHALGRALLYRDGLLLVFAGLVVPRVGSVPKMLLGKHLTESGLGYKVFWSAEEMKGGHPHEAQLGRELSALFKRYIVRHRPVLLRQRKFPHPSEQALWLSKDGKPLSQEAMARVITKRTTQSLGVSVFPHALRHGAATTLAVERPDLIDIATPLLQHRHERTRQLYTLSDGIAASEGFTQSLEARRAGTREGRRLMRRLARTRKRQMTKVVTDALPESSTP